MTTTTHTLNDSMIGQVIGTVSDGYIAKFELVTSQSPAYQIDGWQVFPFPHGSFAGGGRLILRDGDGQGHRLLNFNPSFGQSPYINLASLHYSGGLMLESCPKNAEYRLDLSDAPLTRSEAWAA
jgi:hypothetical protein